MTDSIDTQGYCDERFSSVRDAFSKNFENGLELGASLAVTVNGEFVVDIWGGYMDEAKTRPWEKETIANVYSTTKAMTALCTLMLVDRGLLDLDAPAASYWPEFAQAGKEKILVRHFLSHTSGLAGFEKKIPPEALYDWDRIVGLLAEQEPWWEPGTQSGYHALTFGYLLGELIRRVTGQTVGAFFREEVAEPLGADFHIGLAEEHDSRVAELIPPPELDPPDVAMSELQATIREKMDNPPLIALQSRDRAWRAAEIPAANGHGNARSVARVAALMACGGELDGVRLLSMPTLEKAIEEQSYGPDLVLIMPIRFGLGFGLTSKEIPLGPNPRAFFWGGWGGSLIVMDLDAKVSMAYVMNKMASTTTGDTRVAGPIMALYASLMKF
ncbi:MAG: serine hydrolase domain-containing protein [Candidatus Adiutricales bacterium]